MPPPNRPAPDQHDEGRFTPEEGRLLLWVSCIEDRQMRALSEGIGSILSVLGVILFIMFLIWWWAPQHLTKMMKVFGIEFD